MADYKKLSELDAVTTVAADDLVEIAMANGAGTYISKKIEYANFTNGLGGAERSVNIIIGDASTVIFSNTKGYIGPFSADGTITAWNITEVSETPISGSIVVDIWKSNTVNYPPTVTDTIAGSEKPSLVSQTINSDSTLSSWTTSVLTGDYLGFNVDSVTDCKKVMIILSVDPV
ncbi:MAG: hypothetical protein WC119_05805 [Synergistaceae bacterium]